MGLWKQGMAFWRRTPAGRKWGRGDFYLIPRRLQLRILCGPPGSLSKNLAQYFRQPGGAPQLPLFFQSVRFLCRSVAVGGLFRELHQILKDGAPDGRLALELKVHELFFGPRRARGPSMLKSAAQRVKEYMDQSFCEGAFPGGALQPLYQQAQLVAGFPPGSTRQPLTRTCWRSAWRFLLWYCCATRRFPWRRLPKAAIPTRIIFLGLLKAMGVSPTALRKQTDIR